MIHFITPLYRYDNIKRLYINLLHQLGGCNFNWHLIEGSNKLGNADLSEVLRDDRVKYYKIDTVYPWGHEQRNHFICNITCNDLDWCYFLDDDNMITGDLVDSYIEDDINLDLDVILFAQKAGVTDKIRIYVKNKNSLGCGSTDIGSFLIRYRLLKTLFIHFASERNGDGLLAESIKQVLPSDSALKIYPNRYTRYNVFSHKEIV